MANKKQTRSKKSYQTKKKAKKKIEQAAGIIASILAVVSIIVAIFTNPTQTAHWTQSVLQQLGLATPVLPQSLQAAQGAATKLHFIDVGQGDAVLVEQNGSFALIDAGTPQSAEDLVAYLQAAGVEELELVVMTHPHADHIGGMKAVLEAFSVKEVLFPDLTKAPTPTTAVYLRVLETIEAENIPLTLAQTGQVFPLGQGTITVVSDGIQTDNYNNISVSTLFEVAGLRFLACGDAEKQQERAMLDSGVSLYANVMKSTHHGSHTSNTEDFLRAVMPQLAVVSCAENNDYGHPHAQVMERYAAQGIQVLRTDESGSCIVYLDEAGAIATAAEKAAA